MKPSFFAFYSQCHRHFLTPHTQKSGKTTIDLPKGMQFEFIYFFCKRAKIIAMTSGQPQFIFTEL